MIANQNYLEKNHDSKLHEHKKELELKGNEKEIDLKIKLSDGTKLS